MSDADEAFEAARKLIAEAKAADATELSFDGNSFHSLEQFPIEIVELTKLTSLKVNGTNIANISPLARLSGLNQLWLNSSPIKDLSPLEGLKNLVTLWFADTAVSDLSPVSALTELTELSFKITPVTGIEPIAKLSKLKTLKFNDSEVSDLAPLAGLINLRLLWFQNTPVVDLSPLAGLTALAELRLSDTQVGDLRPIKNLDSLIEASKQVGRGAKFGLLFNNCVATRLDPEGLGRLSKIENNDERTQKTLWYLRGLTEWPPKGVVPQEDQPAGAHFAIGATGRLVLTDPVLTEEDPEQQELHQDCRDKAHRLVGAFGQTNEYADLKSSAEKYREVIARPASAIGARRLWSVGNTLNVALEAQLSAVADGRSTEQLPPLVAAALSDLMATHGLFAMGHSGMAEVIRLIHESTHGPRNAVALQAARNVVASLNDAVAVIEPDALAVLNDDRDAATGVGLAAAKAETGLVGSLRNMFAMVGRAVWSATKNVTGFLVKETVRAVIRDQIGGWIAKSKVIIEAFLTDPAGHLPQWAVWFIDLIKSVWPPES